jgi:hypothetical protein
VTSREGNVDLHSDNGTVLQIDGDSYRMRGHRARLAQLRAGLNQGGEFS